MRDYLVFIRAGSQSLHARMLAEDPNRNWDCCLNAWAATEDETAERHNVEDLVTGGINKFEAFADLFGPRSGGCPYQYVLLLDDDLLFSPGDVSRFFDLCERNRLFLSQPAIAWGSHANHEVNIWNPACEVRQVNFVEVMAPCFSAQAIGELLDTFKLTKCTWGIDYAWSSLLAGQGRLAVVDSVAMHHTKPMDRAEGPFYRMLRSNGIDPDAELAAVHRSFAPWGSMRTLATGHYYRSPIAGESNDHAVAWMERHKLQAHLGCGGTLVPARRVGAQAI